MITQIIPRQRDDRWQNLQISSVNYHRNGSFGAGYFHLEMAWDCDGRHLRGFAVAFPLDDQRSEFVAVIDHFGESWRYEDFAEDILAFLATDNCKAMAWGC